MTFALSYFTRRPQKIQSPSPLYSRKSASNFHPHYHLTIIVCHFMNQHQVCLGNGYLFLMAGILLLTTTPQPAKKSTTITDTVLKRRISQIYNWNHGTPALLHQLSTRAKAPLTMMNLFGTGCCWLQLLLQSCYKFMIVKDTWCVNVWKT